jgi:hypothetical protein
LLSLFAAGAVGLAIYTFFAASMRIDELNKILGHLRIKFNFVRGT